MKSVMSLLTASLILLTFGVGSFDRTLPVSGTVDLDIRSDPGGIVIRAGSTSAVHVHAVIKPVYGLLDMGVSEAAIRALEQNPPIKQTGNRIRLGYVDNPAVSIHFEIETPRATRVHAHTSSGGIRIEGIDGPTITETSSGRTEIRGIAGEVRSTTHSGSIRIDNTTGSVVAHNSSGSIDALRIDGAVDAETQSGAIRISQVNPAPIRARAHSGSIQVDLADGGGYQIDAQSHSGRVAGPVASVDKHRLKQQIGAGGPLVDLDTHSSKIEID